jgi:hypothetical protein
MRARAAFHSADERIQQENREPPAWRTFPRNAQSLIVAARHNLAVGNAGGVSISRRYKGK